MAILTTAEKSALNSIRLLFGKNSRDVKELFESIGMQVVLNYIKGEKVVIPFVGEIEIVYDGDEMTEKGRIARLNTSFTPSSFLIRNIGQIQDNEPTDVEKILIGRFQSVFRERTKN